VTTTEIDWGSAFQTLRRHYLRKRVMARQAGDLALSSVWHARQLEYSSPDLPDGFPSKAALETAGYTAAGDLEGADTAELVEWAGISYRAAQAVIAAAAAL
jgi:hypothetical protein